MQLKIPVFGQAVLGDFEYAVRFEPIRWKVDVANTVVPDELTKNPKPLKIYGIFENQTIKDETAEVRLLNFATGGEAAERPQGPHVDGMLIGQVVESKLIYVTDLISPRGAAIPRSPETIAVGATLREFDVEDDVTIVGGHGGTIKRSEITAALAEEK